MPNPPGYVNYAEASANFQLSPAEAVAFFTDKGLSPSYDWHEMLRGDHDAAFTVAKMMETDLLATVQAKLTQALDKGSTLEDFKRELIPALQKAGWWGKKDVVDEFGNITQIQLGSASRLETIFRSNLQASYAVGHWQAITENARTAPYLMYDAVDDHLTRPEHAARDGEVHPVYSDFWKTHFPPNGWGCRCGVIQLDADDVREMGLTPIASPSVQYRKWEKPRTGQILDVPVDVDPGWDHNPGAARVERLNAILEEKRGALPKPMAEAVKQGLRQRQGSLQAVLGEFSREALRRDKLLAGDYQAVKEAVIAAFGAVAWGPDLKGSPTDHGELTRGERALIYSYTTQHFYGELNRALRRDPENPQYQEITGALTRTLGKAEKYSGESTRGLSFEAGQEAALAGLVNELLQAFGTNDTWQDKGFMSTTAGPTPAKGGQVVLILRGQSGVDIRALSRAPAEREVLYPPGITWHVVGMRRDGDTFYFELREATQ